MERQKLHLTGLDNQICWLGGWRLITKVPFGPSRRVKTPFYVHVLQTDGNCTLYSQSKPGISILSPTFSKGNVVNEQLQALEFRTRWLDRKNVLCDDFGAPKSLVDATITERTAMVKRADINLNAKEFQRFSFSQCAFLSAHLPPHRMKSKRMVEAILLRDVPKLGQQAGVLRHHLYPSGDAVYATDTNVMKFVAPLFSRETAPTSQQLNRKIQAAKLAAQAEMTTSKNSNTV
ncbi:hypothetical protein PSACC_02386 [Paramicrosporidium saccamoebae]|uniref:Uncharacterized protein n=1 Tax=Paramicrosporidium saccamoebae TaxID=1246581 RepID=A0A2H9TJ33_9FUNG|nr:hypothetical protein PSACC_02386 [Paramicrosporidium saccamoebae]